MTVRFIFIFPLSHLCLSFVLNGKKGDINKLLSGKKNQRKNLDHVQSLPPLPALWKCVDSTQSLRYPFAFPFHDAGTFSRGFKVVKMIHLDYSTRGLPWWLSGIESACPCRRHKFDSWSEKIPHDMEQHCALHLLSLCFRAQEPQLLKPMHPRVCVLQQVSPPQ